MGVIVYNGVSSEDVGVFVEYYPDYTYASKTYKVADIEGRNGSLIVGGGYYKNVTQSYRIAFKPDLNESYDVAAARVAAWLHSYDGGYARLEDSYEPNVYRMAAYAQGATLTTFLRKAGRATIQFNCMPQRWLKSGEELINIDTSGAVIMNPTNKPAKPIITVHCDEAEPGGEGEESVSITGVLEINDYQISISDITDGMQIDCDLENVSSGALNLNNKVTLGPNWFPILEPGQNNIVFSGGITGISILPRWWII